MFSLLLSLSLFFSSLAAASSPMSIFILAGQSNMSGRGGVINGTHGTYWDQFVPPECSPNSSILRLNKSLVWEEAKEPLHYDIDELKVCGIGPGMAFANSILKIDSTIARIGLVPCAIGGTTITEWSHGSVYYDQMVRRSEAALEGGGKLRGILWYQGESDAKHKEDAMLYRSRLEKFFKDVRSDLQSSSLPIIQVAIAQAEKYGQYVDIIRQVQLENEVPSVDAKDLELGLDGLHLTTAAQVELGKMLAAAWSRISSSPQKSHSSTVTLFSSNSKYVIYVFFFINLSNQIIYV